MLGQTTCVGSTLEIVKKAFASSTKAEYYRNCYEPVQHLRATDSDMTRSVVAGAAIGAAGYYAKASKPGRLGTGALPKRLSNMLL